MSYPKKRVWCNQCHRQKMLFATEEKALRFIEFNSDDIAECGDKVPIRAYYCEACGGWHITATPLHSPRIKQCNNSDTLLIRLNKIATVVMRGFDLLPTNLKKAKAAAHHATLMIQDKSSWEGHDEEKGVIVDSLLKLYNSIMIEELKKSLRVVPDFPKKGIQFQDITTLWKDSSKLDALAYATYLHYAECGITKVVGIESRGFVLGGILSTMLPAGFVPARKPGKLPAPAASVSYSKEYGEDSICIHTDAIEPTDVVLISDDLAATCGTANAVVELVHGFGVPYENIYVNCSIDLVDVPHTPFPEGVKFWCPLEISGVE